MGLERLNWRDDIKPMHGVMPKTPRSTPWEFTGYFHAAPAYVFRHPLGLVVLSSVNLYRGKREYHVSISDAGGRIAASLVPVILEQFDCVGFEEDNHVPGGNVRNFFRAIDEEQKECGCKAEEKPTIEGDYIWRPDNEGR